MTRTTPLWIRSGRGEKPEVQWSLTVDAPLANLRLARESGDLLAADASGGLYRIDLNGHIASLTRGFLDLTGLAFSDTGQRGAAVVEQRKLSCFDGQLKVVWTIELPESVTTIAMDPQGYHLGVALANGRNVIYDVNRRRVCDFTTDSPLQYWEFLTTEPAIVAAAEYGLICKYDFQGREIWQEKLSSNIGDLKITGDGNCILLPVFNHGIRSFNSAGEPSGSFMIEGTAHRLACSFTGNRLLVTTLEGHLYWIDSEGNLIWGAVLPEDIEQVACDPLGNGLYCGFGSGRVMHLIWKFE
ncbi:MAG: hypothetical protein Tsb009_21650 [Planctomycetaceae bacterium]